MHSFRPSTKPGIRAVVTKCEGRTQLRGQTWGSAVDAFDSDEIVVVVTDVKLPAREPQGLALARMIRNRRPQVPIILTSAHPELLGKDVVSPGSPWRSPTKIRARVPVQQASSRFHRQIVHKFSGGIVPEPFRAALPPPHSAS
jgi:hypothetical protein